MRASPSIDGNAVFSELIGEVYQIASRPESWPAILRRTCIQFRGQSCILASYDIIARRGRIRLSSVLDGQPMGATFAWLDDGALPDGADVAHAKPGSVWIRLEQSQGRPGDDVDRTNEWAAPYGHYLMTAVLCRYNLEMELLSVARAARIGPFAEREVTLFRQLAAHMRRAMELRRDFETVAGQSDLVAQMFDHLQLGVIVVDEHQKPVAINMSAREIVACNDTLSFGPDGIRTERNAEMTALRTLVAAALSSCRVRNEDAEVGVMRLTREPHRRPLSLIVCPLQSQVRDVAEARRGVGIILSDPDRAIRIDRRWLTRLYGLTRAEADVASLMAEGKVLKDVAETLDITVNTARTHLKHIFAKIGIARQAELVCLLLSGLRQIRGASIGL